MSLPERLPADQQSIRRHNLGLIARAVSAAPGSRAELAQRTGLTKATVSSLVDSLLAQGILTEGEPAPARVGRPARPVSLNPAGPVALGLEINVDYLAGCRMDLTGAVQDRRLLAVDNRPRSAADIVEQLCELAGELRPPGTSLLGVALAVPGVVGASRRLLRAPNLPKLTGQPLAEQLGQRLTARSLLALPDHAAASDRPTDASAAGSAAGSEAASAAASEAGSVTLGGPAPEYLVLMDNEANLGALGWLRGSTGRRDFVYVSGEIGVGAGLVVDGSLFRGASGFAGELGHVVVDRDGPPCGCGGRGCVEAYAGLQVLLHASGRPDLASLSAAAAARDERASVALTAAGSALGVGLASLLNVVDLPAVVLGGVYASLFDLIAPPLRAELARRVLSGAPVELARSGLGIEAAVRGAAGAVVERTLSDPGALAGPAR
jgi:predicted NBD/HSP70 family sugar kinase